MNAILPAFDFTEALGLSVDERIAKSVAKAREMVDAMGYQGVTSAPCIPEAATEDEIKALQAELQGKLPSEYAHFLGQHRYLLLGDGWEVGGLDHEGVHHTEMPWLSDEHRPDHEYIVFANYWHYSDGDQLLIDTAAPGSPVLVYLHEHGPAFEPYAPSFSLALWRLVHESPSLFRIVPKI